MSDRRLAIGGGRPLVLKQERFFPAGTYAWVVPAGCTEVDVFLVGGGGGAADAAAGGGGFTKTFKKDTSGWRDGDAVPVTPGEAIQIIVGGGGVSYARNPATGGTGGYSQFKNSNYIANGGGGGIHMGSGKSIFPGSGGSGAPETGGRPGSDGKDGTATSGTPGKGQGHTTRDFGESTGKRNAGAGGYNRGATNSGGASDYTEGTGGSMRGSNNNVNVPKIGYGGGGYGGGAGGCAYSTSTSGGGGDGTVLIRYYAYE